MTTFKVLYRAADKTAYVLPNAQANIAGTTGIGTFDHDNDPDDELGSDVNHVAYHHVQDLLYKQGEQNMQSVKIVIVPTEVVLYPSELELDLADAAPVQLKWDLVPDNGLSSAVTFASSAADKATVSEDGVVTAVAVGETTITMTHTLTGLTDTCVVTVVDTSG